jgi:hypothetical protein
MKTTTSTFQVGDIIQMTEPYGGRFEVIVALHLDKPKNKYACVSMSGKSDKRYNLADDQIARRIGQLDADAPILTDQVVKPKPQQNDDGNDAKRWAILNSACVGDRIVIRSNRQKDVLAKDTKGYTFRTEAIDFICLVPRGRKFVWAGANRNGTEYSYPLSVIVVDDGD